MANNNLVWKSKYFYGVELSARDLSEGHISYGTLAKAFNHILANTMATEIVANYEPMELISGGVDHSEEIDAIRDKIEQYEDYKSELEDASRDLGSIISDLECISTPDDDEDDARTWEVGACTEEIARELGYQQNYIDDGITSVEELIDSFEREIEELEEDDDPGEVFQWFIIDALGVEILTELGEVVYYCEDLDVHFWGVTHFGTSWDYVNTAWRVEIEEPTPSEPTPEAVERYEAMFSGEEV